MLIQELEQKSGLPRATIRYYEKEGFLTPNRLENGYRVYTDEDLDQLMKIHLLRELGMSLDTIQRIRKGEGDFHQALSEQVRSLDNLSKTAQRAKDVCELMYKGQETYADLDAAFYLHELSKPALPQPPVETPVIPERTNEPYYRPYHPVRRFLARITDYQIFIVLVQFVLVVICRVRPIPSAVNSIISFAIPFLLIPIESFMLSKWGATPGKWLFGLSAWDKNGYTLSYEEAKTRSWRVIKEGYGFGIPGYNLYRLYKSYMQYGDVELDWDQGVEYEYHPWTTRRKLSVVAVTIVLIGLSATSVLCAFNPKNRGELTVSQFADNYNFYVDVLDQGSGIESTLKEDGTFYNYPSDVVTIGSSGNLYPENRNFTYEIENGKITSVIYECEYMDAFIVRPQPEQCLLAAVTMVMSQKGNHAIDLISFLKQMEKKDFTESGSARYKNVDIEWVIEKSNYVGGTGAILIQEDQDQSSRVKIHYLITASE